MQQKSENTHKKEEREGGAGVGQRELSEFNELLSCRICRGYMIDPTTVDSCYHTCKSNTVFSLLHFLLLYSLQLHLHLHLLLLLLSHSFADCRSCILKHLLRDVYCPQCKASGGKQISEDNLR